MSDETHPSPRRFFQFPLRTLLIFVTVVAIGAWWRWQKTFRVESSISKRKLADSTSNRKFVTVEQRKVETMKREGINDVVKHGPTRIYDEDGKLIFEEGWYHGVRHGVYRKWNEVSGELLVDVEFEKGRVVRVRDNPITESIFNISTDNQRGKRIRSTLTKKTRVDYLGQPLTDVMEDISYTHSIPLLIDTRCCEDAGIDIGSPVTCPLRNVPLSIVLLEIVGKRHLTCAYCYEMLWITTPDSELNAPDRVPRVTLSEASAPLLQSLTAEARSVDYLEMPLASVLKDIAFMHDIEIDNSVTPASSQPKVTLQLQSVSLRSALNILLYNQNLRGIAQNDKLIVVEANRRHKVGADKP